MAKSILQGTVKGARRRGRQKKRWEDNIKEWTRMGFGDFLMAAEDMEGWKGIVTTLSVVPRRPPRLRDWDEMRWGSSFVSVTHKISRSDNVSQNSGKCTRFKPHTFIHPKTNSFVSPKTVLGVTSASPYLEFEFWDSWEWLGWQAVLFLYCVALWFLYYWRFMF